MSLRRSVSAAATALLATATLLATGATPATASPGGAGFFDGYGFLSVTGGKTLPLVDSAWRDATTFHRDLAIRAGVGIGGDGDAIQLEANFELSEPSDELSRYRGLFGLRLELMSDDDRLLKVFRIAFGLDTIKSDRGRDVGINLELGTGLWLHLGSVLFVGAELNLPLSAHILEDDAPGDGIIDLNLLGGLMIRETFK